MAKKGQLAMETVMNYGIILVVVMIAVGALLYFGVLDLGEYLPDKCDFAPADFQCSEYQVSSTDKTITVIITNVVGRGVLLASASAFPAGSGESGCGIPVLAKPNAAGDWDTLVTSPTSDYPYIWANGEKLQAVYTCNAMAKGDKTDLSFKINYKLVGKTLAREATGTVKVKAT